MGAEALGERRRGAVEVHPAAVVHRWRGWIVAERVRVLRAWRRVAALRTEEFCAAVGAGVTRTDADVLVTEVLPLLAACEFLERNAAKVLAVRRLGRSGRPVWVGKVASEVHRVPLGRVLVIGPSNYPLFLPGVQVLQALTAGNAVTWKPGRGGLAVARLVAGMLTEAGLPSELLRVTEDTDEAGEAAVAAGADKVFFTGSAAAGRAVLRRLAETATPAVMELSDSSAVVVLPGADVERVVAAVVFGMRLNGSATCMAPRRLLVIGSAEKLTDRLREEFARVPGVRLDERVSGLLRELTGEARGLGATIFGTVEEAQRPVLVAGARPEMRVSCADIFAPVLSVMEVESTEEILAAQRACGLALSVSIFGEEMAARRLGERMRVGTVVVNDVIAPTADPRVPFGGRRASGFGVTRGAEGLLDMTAVKTVLAQRGTSRRHYEATGAIHAEMFRGLIAAGHAGTWRERFAGIRDLVEAARRLNRKG